MEMLRNNSAIPGALPGLRIFAKTVTNGDGGATHTYVLETGCAFVIFALAYAGTTVIAPTIASSTLIVGTLKITWTIPISGVMRLFVVASNEQDNSLTSSVDVTGDVDFDR
jgi:hypothetical protein